MDFSGLCIGGPASGMFVHSPLTVFTFFRPPRYPYKELPDEGCYLLTTAGFDGQPYKYFRWEKFTQDEGIRVINGFLALCSWWKVYIDG